MYSGQEIVSQEECKIVLAEFYEGVDCYNQEDGTIKFILLDWATATYNPVTFTLDTRNFSCKPVIITDDLRVTFEATLPEGTTGLEVHMHTAEYERTRIMPLIYLPMCSTIHWDDPYNNADWAYVEKFCNETTTTVVDIRGELDAITSTMVSVVGYQGELDSTFAPLYIEFLDGGDTPINITPIITTETRDVIEWDYVDGELIKQTVQKEILIITVGLAVKIRFSGLYEYTATLYGCSYLYTIGDVAETCNITTPTFETRVTSLSPVYTELADGWFDINGTTEFRLLPSTTFKRLEGNVFYFNGADQIEYRKPREATYDIFNCIDDPSNYSFFYQYPMFYYDTSWCLEIYVVGSYSVASNCITDDTTGDQYCYFTNSSDTPITLVQAVDDRILVCGVPDCSVYYKVNGGVAVPVVTTSKPYPTDYRTVWDQTKCKFVVTCLSVGGLPCPCIECTPQGDGESVRIWTDGLNGVCGSGGSVPEYETVIACEAGAYFGLGSYPDVPVVFPPSVPSAAASTVSHVFIVGLDMYIALPTLVGFTYYTWVGNLGYGVNITEIEDEATKLSKSVLLLPYIYLNTFNFPYEYVKSDSLDQQLWWDTDIWSDDYIRIMCYDHETFGELPCFGWELPPCEVNWPPESFCDDPDYGKTAEELLMKGITEAGGLWDFKITLTELQSRIPGEFGSGYDWGRSCGWTYAKISRPAAQIDMIIGVNNTSDMDDVSCEDDIKIKYFFTNASLRYVKQPLASYGAYQTLYDEYVEAVSLLTSDDAEAFALYTGIY